MARTPESIARWQNILESNRLNPYRSETHIHNAAYLASVKKLIQDPKGFFQDYRKIDTLLRGRDIGGLGDRAKRVGVFGVIMGAALLTDKLVSMENLNTAFAQRDKDWNPIPAKVEEGQKSKYPYEWFHINLGKKKVVLGEGLAKLLDVFADKFVVNGFNHIVYEQTGGKKNGGDKNFVSDFSEQIGDMANVAFDDAKDLLNGTALEMAVRIVSQIPILGAFVEVPYAAVNRLITKNAVTKLTGKAGAIGIGVMVRAILQASNGQAVPKREEIMELAQFA